jgi:hypothetical protein
MVAWPYCFEPVGYAPWLVCYLHFAPTASSCHPQQALPVGFQPLSAAIISQEATNQKTFLNDLTFHVLLGWPCPSPPGLNFVSLAKLSMKSFLHGPILTSVISPQPRPFELQLDLFAHLFSNHIQFGPSPVPFLGLFSPPLSSSGCFLSSSLPSWPQPHPTPFKAPF